MIAFIIIGYIFVSFEYPTTCIYTTEWINKIGVWEKHNSYDDYETLFWNGVIQRDSDSIKLYYIVPFNSNGELLDTIKFETEAYTWQAQINIHTVITTYPSSKRVVANPSTAILSVPPHLNRRPGANAS